MYSKFSSAGCLYKLNVLNVIITIHKYYNVR